MGKKLILGPILVRLAQIWDIQKTFCEFYLY